MAQRRMFSLKVIDTDDFLDMPQSAQALYFHLAMRADDDGFVASPRKIMKICNSSDDDYRLLMAKRFLIPFESGLCVIRHWRIHNYIQSDRYNETIYVDEKAQIEEKNGKYEPMYPERIHNGPHNVSTTDTQVRLGKDRIGKSSKTPTEAAEPQSDQIDDAPFGDQDLPAKAESAPAIADAGDEQELYKAVQADFLQRQPAQRFTDYGKEGKAIKQLIEKAKARSPDKPAEFLDSMIKMFRYLRNSGDKFWRGQPDLPSALNASGIWDRVLNEGYERYQAEVEAEDIYEGVPW